MWLPDHLKSLVKLDPRAPAVEAEGRWWTWDDIAQWQDRVAEIAAENGVLLPADIAVVMESCFTSFATMAAVLSTGSTLIPLSPLKSTQSLAEEVGGLQPQIVMARDQHLLDQTLRDSISAVGAIGVSLGTGRAEFAEVSVRPNGRPHTERSADADVAVRMGTSGTTGPPKRVSLRYNALEQTLRHVRSHHAAGDDEKAALRSGTVILMNPPVHMAGFDAALRTMVEGRKACLLERFTVDGFVAALRRHTPRIVGLVPAALRMLYEADVPVDAFDATEVVLSGSAPLSNALWRDFESRYGVAILVNYGATEFAGGIAGWTAADHARWIDAKRGSVGRPHPGTELRVVDDTGVPIPVGERGTLEVRSVHLSGSWTRTSDLARIDEDDFLWLEGRSDGVITRGGFKVWPADVESVLENHPAVREACVVAKTDTRLGEVPVAVVELVAGTAPPTPSDLISWSRARLTGYQTPVELMILDALPRTQSMKVARGEVRDLVTATTDSDGQHGDAP